MKKRHSLGGGLYQDVDVQHMGRNDLRMTVRTHDDPVNKKVLQENAELRKAGGPRVTDGLGLLALQIPAADYMRMVAANPDLGSPDGKVQTKAWRKVMQDPAFKQYRTRDKI